MATTWTTGPFLAPSRAVLRAQATALFVIIIGASGCAHFRTRAGLMSAAAAALDCSQAQLLVTEYESYPFGNSTVEGCKHIGSFAYRDGRWRLQALCEFRITPDIPSDHSPNRGGTITCVKECDGIEQCADLLRSKRDSG